MRNDVAVVAAIALFGMGACWWLVGWLRGYALRRNLIDAVGERTSHLVATPRGGGLAITIVGSVIIVSAPIWCALPTVWAAGLVSGGLVVAIAGWIDDHGHVAARYRLLAHCCGAGLVTAAVGPIPLAWLGWNYPVVEWALSLVMIVWLINLFNFMDGIDGLATSEAITAWAGLAVVLFALSAAPATAMLALSLAVTSVGFLLWNWPPAKIFMGDVASGYLGLVSGALVLFAAQSGERFAAALLVMLAVFVVDATVTLLRRATYRQPVYEAHRSHAYQILSRRWQSHRKVTCAVAGINILVLLPIAALTAAGLIGPVTAVLISYGPLAFLALWIGAGSDSAG